MTAVTQDGLMEELSHYAKTDQVSYLENLIIQLQDRMAELERKCWHLEDDIRGIRYTAEDAQTKAENAEREAQRAQRGW